MPGPAPTPPPGRTKPSSSRGIGSCQLTCGDARGRELAVRRHDPLFRLERDADRRDQVAPGQAPRLGIQGEARLGAVERHRHVGLHHRGGAAAIGQVDAGGRVDRQHAARAPGGAGVHPDAVDEVHRASRPARAAGPAAPLPSSASTIRLAGERRARSSSSSCGLGATYRSSEPAEAIACSTAQLCAAAWPPAPTLEASPASTATTRRPTAARRRRHHEAIAAVVARAAEDRGQRRLGERAARATGRLGQPPELGERHLGHGGAGALHQGVLRQAKALGGGVDLRHLRPADQDGDLPDRPCGRIGHSRVFR